MTRRDFACDCMWTERPLVQFYIEQTGQPTFSLKALIAFAEQLPEKIFERLAKQSGPLDSQSGALASPPKETSISERAMNRTTRIHEGQP